MEITDSLNIRKQLQSFFQNYGLELVLVFIILFSWSISFYRFWIFESIVSSTPDAWRTYFVLADSIFNYINTGDSSYLHIYLTQPVSNRIIYPFLLAILKLFFPVLDYYTLAFLLAAIVSLLTYSLIFKITRFFTIIKYERFLILYLYISISTVSYHSLKPITDFLALLFALISIYGYFAYKESSQWFYIVLVYIGMILAFLTREVYFFYLKLSKKAPSFRWEMNCLRFSY